ncbi:MAG: CHASE2 domain-containing protein [Sulfuricella sp.]|nr:CHASE2 domain-containing protein [Sulfuricella sp.]
MKKDFWKADWFWGVIIALVFLAAANTELLQSLERKAYDLGVQSSSRAPGDKVAVIAIDDQSIANMGRWPWPRDIHAKMTDMLSGAQAKVIGNTIFFFEPQLDPGLVHVNRMLEFYGGSPLKDAPGDAAQLGAMLQDAEQSLNTDRKLAASMASAKNVLLPAMFQLGAPHGKPDKPLPDYLLKYAIPAANIKDNVGAEAAGYLPLPALSAIPPIPELGTVAAGIGHLNSSLDVDGSVRSEPLVLHFFDQYIPSLSVMLAAKSLNLEPKDIRIRLGEGLNLGNLRIATDPYLQMHTYFYKDRDGRPAFPVDSFYDVYTGKIPATKYRDKIVLIGATAAGVGTAQVTPVSPATAPVLTLAHSVSSILNEHFFVAPAWSFWAEKALFLVVALYLILLLPRLKAGMGAALTGSLLVLLVGAHFVLMTTQGIWLQLMIPALLLVVGHLLLTTKRHLLTEKYKLKSDAESAESNRMLGLAFQGQGQLDMAFEKFRKCPLDDSLMDVLYNLALDFERKRQFNKAVAVFQYMADHNPKFRDLEQRLKRSTEMSETVILGGAGTRSNASTLISQDGSVAKPMLGRYQVEKELGKGAMGVVYLGKDPKIGRIVAIKTMALSQEFDEDELVDVKERFFREAETAGRLSHPNIVTIFDAGEEHDLAYIAMEFLKGKDLVPFTKSGNLLPLPTVLSIAMRVADALNYAHAQHVVHRDIKPANIMYEPESDSVKVTDFGIARITDSSKTKTGMVLGTPSYMSPEQLAGRKIEGQSDLFSLGVAFFQMLTGQLPFQGDSMAQLMFKIANEPTPDILQLNPNLPLCVVKIVNRMMEKDVAQRYRNGAEIVQDIRACLAELSSGDVIEEI